MTKTIRVLHVIGSMDRGGAETMIMNLYRNMDREKIQFDFLVSSNRIGAYDAEIKQLGGNIYHIKHFNGLNPASYFLRCLSFFKKHDDFSIVHGHIGSSAALYLLAARLCGLYTIAHSHNGKPSLSLHSIAYSFYSYPTRYIANHLFGCSTEAGIARFGNKSVNSLKYSNFNNGISLEEFRFNKDIRSALRESLGLPMDAIVIGTVGRISEQKNPEKILDIFSYAICNFPNCYCLWVGSGEQYDDINKRIEELNYGSKIKLLGVRNDVPHLLQTFDCFLFPSLWEGLPLTIIEAQASGLPVVLSNSISKEVELTNLLTWMDIHDATSEWSSICYKRACEFKEWRERDYISKLKSYDIKYTSKSLSDFYLNHC